MERFIFFSLVLFPLSTGGGVLVERIKQQTKKNLMNNLRFGSLIHIFWNIIINGKRTEWEWIAASFKHYSVIIVWAQNVCLNDKENRKNELKFTIHSMMCIAISEYPQSYYTNTRLIYILKQNRKHILLENRWKNWECILIWNRMQSKVFVYVYTKEIYRMLLYFCLQLCSVRVASTPSHFLFWDW